LAKFPVCRTALLAYWINLLLLGITLYFSGVCAEETGVVQDEMPRDVPTAIKRRIVIGQGLYAFGALLCVVSTYLSIAFIVLVYAAIKTNAYNWPDNTKVKAASEI